MQFQFPSAISKINLKTLAENSIIRRECQTADYHRRLILTESAQCNDQSLNVRPEDVDDVRVVFFVQHFRKAIPKVKGDISHLKKQI